MSLTSTMAYALLIFSILSIIVDVNTIMPHTQLKTSTVPLNENSTEYDYSQTTTDTVKAVYNSRLYNISKFEEVTHNPLELDTKTLFRVPSLFLVQIENLEFSNLEEPPEENSTSTTMSITTYSADIESGNHDMQNEEKVTQSPPHFDSLPFIQTSTDFTLPVENTSDASLEENCTSTTMPTTTYFANIENGNHDMQNEEEVKHNLSDVGGTNILPLIIKTHIINNTFGKPLAKSNTRIYPSKVVLTTDSTDTKILPFNMSNYKDVCGRQLIKMARIVGGNNVSFGEWPWQISLRHQKQSIHKCGAVLINENWAVTTAHCVKNVPVTDIHLVFGKYDFLVKDELYGNVTRKLQTVITHPKFKSNETNYDLALLKFDKPVKFQPNILPVCIPEDDFNFVGYSARVTGWGTLYYGGHWPTILQGVTVPVVSNSVCERMFLAAGYVKKIPDTFICAGTEKGGFDACKGDSGGPMVVQRPDKRWLVAGITSWGMRCGEPNSPGVYMRISKFKDWINQIILQS